MTAITDNLQRSESLNIISPKGFKSAGIHCGLKAEKKDLALLVSDVPANVAGVFTTNVIKAAPLLLTKEVVHTTGKMQAIIVNSGNANACTGKKGIEDAHTMQKLAAEKLSIAQNLVGVCSTGVIGELLPMDTVKAGISKIEAGTRSEDALDFSQAILTTDTATKHTGYTVKIDGKEVIIAGVAKGSGMIKPNMATMLAYVTTDANISHENLQALLADTTEKTFNAITVDGDTSTNDTVLVLANGLAKNNELTPDHPEWSVFKDAFNAACEDLSKMIAKDGEGATKLIEVNVTGAQTDIEALQIAKTVVGSSLVKTAVFGCDANWGRIICAVGYSGMTVNPETITIQIGSTPVVQFGEPIPFSEEDLKEYLKKNEVKISVDMGIGDGKGTAWGCDLTYDYVQINASYRS